MNLHTINILSYCNDGATVEESETIKVSLENGEVLIGTYSYSDFTSLTIERENGDINIEFEDIKDIDEFL